MIRLMKYNRLFLSTFFLALSLPGYSSLLAQEAVQADLGEVVVTDSALEEASSGDGETYDREGVTVDVLDGEDLSLWNADSPRDLPARVPNFFTTDTGTQGFGDIMTMRGLGNTSFFSNPSVVYYVDGVAQGDVFTYADSLYDVDSVEVFRGPQGARFGRNSYGGVVNVTTKRPENEFHGSLGTTYGEYNRFGTNGSVSGALIDDVLKFRLNGYHTERDGFLYNPALGFAPDDESRSGGGDRSTGHRMRIWRSA